jgi:hypothetical protein
MQHLFQYDHNVVRNSVHHVYPNVRQKLSDKWRGGGGGTKLHMCCVDTFLKSEDCETALSYIQVNTVCCHHGLMYFYLFLIFCKNACFCVMNMCIEVEIIDVKTNKDLIPS